MPWSRRVATRAVGTPSEAKLGSVRTDWDNGLLSQTRGTTNLGLLASCGDESPARCGRWVRCGALGAHHASIVARVDPDAAIAPSQQAC